MSYRKDPLSIEGFEASGADWLQQYKPYIHDGNGAIIDKLFLLRRKL